MPNTILEMILGCVQQQKEGRITLSDAMAFLEEFDFDFDSGENESEIKWVTKEKPVAEFSNLLGDEPEAAYVALSNFGVLTYSSGNNLR